MQRGSVDVIALEANFTESLDLDRYVAGESLEPRDAVRRLGFWMWRNQEFLDLVELVRAHNTKPGARRVRMLGVDMQEPKEATARLLAELRPVLGRKRHAEEVATLAPFAADDTYTAFRALSPEQRRAVESLLRRLVARIPRDAPVELRWNGRIALQAATLFQHRDASDFSDIRDELLGQNAERALRDFGRGQRQVILGHNSHVAAAPFRAGPSMGTVLRRLIGASYVTIGVVVDSGSVMARPAGGDLATVRVEPVDSPLQRVLRSVSPDDYYLDLVSLATSSRDWWMVPWPMREFGAIFRSGDSLRSRRLPEHFDLILFLHTVSPIVVFPK
jgi:erythromycin esterase-like protein